MRAVFKQAGFAVAAWALAVAGCSPGSDASSLLVSQAHLLPARVADTLPDRRLNVVWAPEMTTCTVCNAPVAEALGRFAADYPETGVVTALVADAPFPEELVVGRKLVVAAAEPSESPQGRRPYIAVLDSDRQLLGWRRISNFGRQDDFVYQELLGAYSLTAPLE